INLKHPLVLLADKIDWQFLDGRFASVCTDGPGQPGLPTRLVAGRFILKHMENLSGGAPGFAAPSPTPHQTAHPDAPSASAGLRDTGYHCLRHRNVGGVYAASPRDATASVSQSASGQQ